MARSASSYNAIPYPALVVDQQAVIHQANDAAQRLLGDRMRDLIDHDIHEVSHPHVFDREHCPICRSIHEGQEMSPSEFGDMATGRWFLYSLNRIDAPNGVPRMVQVMSDVSYNFV